MDKVKHELVPSGGEKRGLKALILAAGRGSRLGNQTESDNKCMLNLFDRPILQYNLENIARTQIEEMVIVVGYKAEEIINRYGNEFRNKSVRYVIQNERRGLVHAIQCATDALEGEDFALFLGDEVLINPRHNEMIREFKTESLFGICGVFIQKERTKIRRTYTIIEDSNHRIYRLIEKPRDPASNIMGTGNCVFVNEITQYIERTPINQERGERELPDMVQCAVDEGKIVKSFTICDDYANVNSEADLKEATKLLSARIESAQPLAN